MYSIQEVEFGPITKLELINEGAGELVSFVPEFGASLLDLTLSNGKHSINLMEGPASYEELLADKSFFGRVLCPWPNRVSNGLYKFNDKQYVLPINEKERKNALHGLLFDKEFSVVHKEASTNMASVTMHYEYEGDYEGYPFDFLLELTYNLNENGFEVEVNIENIFSTDLPVGFGFHPYFRFSGMESIDELQLMLPQCARYELSEQCIPKGEPKEYKDFKKFKSLEGVNLDDAFMITDSVSRRHSVQLKNPSRKETLELWMEGGKEKFNYFQVYTPEDRKSIAIEPMTCNINAFNNKQGLIILDTDDTLELNFGISLK